MIELCWN